MCGINGYIQFNQEKNEQKLDKIINQMNALIVHRGPDDDGTYVDSHAAFGMRRLSIIGLSDGQQPIFNEDQTMLIVFNGELYNYKALKQQLAAKGHVFSTSSDTEVVLHLYEEYGAQAFTQLIGMYAFAIYHIPTKRLVIVRDLAGEKPLHYYKDNNRLIFGSEIKSLFCSGEIKKSINMTALNQYLSLTYIPAPLTIFSGIYKLPPASYMEVDAKGNVIIEKYWDVIYDDSTLITDYQTCKQQLRETLTEAVDKCMVADVPIGAFLSGGIDSSIIVGLMSTLSETPIDTFTIGYKDKHFDESNLAAKTAAFNHTRHHTFMLDYDDVFDELDTIVGALDEPFADSSAIPTYMVSRFTGKQIKTVLTGDAGDELFAGYQKYLIGHYTETINRIPNWITNGVLKPGLRILPDQGPFTRKARKVLDNVGLSIFEQRKALMSLGFKPHELIQLFTGSHMDPKALDLIRTYYDTYKDQTAEISRAQYTDFKVVLEGDMFHKVDRMSMFHALETRSPLVSKNVVELAARIPSAFKIKGKHTKIILKDTFKDYLAPEVLNGKKHGFSVPIGTWLSGPLKDELLRLTSESFIESQGLFNYDYIKSIINEHLSGSYSRFSELWLIFVFQRWYKRNFKS